MFTTIFNIKQGDVNDTVESDNQDITLKPLDKYRKPLIVVGQSGSGKTAIMAKIAEESKKWCVCYYRNLYCSYYWLMACSLNNNLK